MIEYYGNNDYRDYLIHYGVLGMHWGIRRYQPYSVRGRKSGKGGKEIGEAKKSPVDKMHISAKKAEPRITNDVLKAARQSGSKMYGLGHRLKTKESIARKIKTDAIEKDISYQEAAKGIRDTVRYTTISDDANFTRNYKIFKANLQQKGYEEVRCRNYFRMYDEGKVKHKSVQSVFKDPEGFDFEVQFHTPSSQAAKDEKVPIYEERRKPGLTRERQIELEKQMDDLAKRVKRPKNVYSIKSHG